VWYRDFDTANSILPTIPREQYNNIARFLESQGFKEEALHVADDPDVKFDLALQLNKLEVRATSPLFVVVVVELWVWGCMSVRALRATERALQLVSSCVTLDCARDCVSDCVRDHVRRRGR
jgi:hypothetical protein